MLTDPFCLFLREKSLANDIHLLKADAYILATQDVNMINEKRLSLSLCKSLFLFRYCFYYLKISTCEIGLIPFKNTFKIQNIWSIRYLNLQPRNVVSLSTALVQIEVPLQG